jgi:hypothetical protein
MNNLLFFCLLLLTSCATISHTGSIDSVPPIRDVLDTREACPHLCWLGINPGATATGQAKTLIGNSNSIDQQWTRVSDSDLFARWFVGGSRSSTCTIGIQLEKGVVQSISLGPMPYTVGDMVEIIGQPDQIAITQLTAPDQPYFTYALYYVNRRVTVDVHTTSTNGPQPTDKGYDLWLNAEFYAVTHPQEWGKPQSWLGYGHIQEYLPGLQIPPTSLP